MPLGRKRHFSRRMCLAKATEDYIDEGGSGGKRQPVSSSHIDVPGRMPI